MLKKIIILLLITFSLLPCNQARREPFNERRIIGYVATNYLWEQRSLEAQSLTLYELFQELAVSFGEFFDVKNNHESYDSHIKRLRSFVALIKERLTHHRDVEEEYQDDLIPFQEAFGEVLTFEEFKEKIIVQTKNIDEFLRTIAKTHSKFKIAYAFRKFTSSIPDGLIALISARNGNPVSAFELWGILKYRLGLD